MARAALTGRHRIGREPAPYAPEFYIVRGKHTVGQVESLECQFNIQDVQLLKRTDAFTRR